MNNDKERLEEAKLMAEMLRVETRLPHDFPFDLVDWLVEQAEQKQSLETAVDFYQSALRDADRRVQELEELLTQIKYDKEAHIALSEKYLKKQLQNKRYREAFNKSREIWDKAYENYKGNKTEYLDGMLDGAKFIIDIFEKALEGNSDE